MRTMKGQAAMEYLMTYGWAILALVVVIALLMATGVFNPSYIVSEECTIQPDLSCGSYILYNGNDGFTYLKFRVDNGLGYDIRVDSPNTNIVLKTQGSDEVDWVSPAITSSVIPQGKNATITLRYNGENAPLKGELMKMNLQLTYVTCAPEVNPDCLSSGPEHTVSGRIIARTEEEN